MLAMRARLHVPVPSLNLLRYLQFQSEECCFFSANSQAFSFDQGSRSRSHPHTARGLRTSKPLSSHLWAPIPSMATYESSVLNLEFLFPRIESPGVQPTLGSYRRLGKGTKRSTKQLIGGYRCSSESYSSNWLRRAFGRKVNRRRPLKGVDTPHGDEGVEVPAYALGRTMSAKTANEQKLRCTEFDENGNVVLVNGEFKKSELIAKASYPPQNTNGRRPNKGNSTDYYLEIFGKSTHRYYHISLCDPLLY